LENAINAFQKLIINYPSYPEYMECYFRLGKNLFNSGHSTEAKNVFLNYIANTDFSDKIHNEALLYLERIAYKKGGSSAEIEIYETFSSKYPENPLTPKILFDLIRYYIASAQIEKAYKKYAMLMSNPVYSAFVDSAAFLLADTYISQNRKEEALSILKTITNSKSDSLITQKRLFQSGFLYEKWELNVAAISSYERSYAFKTSPEISVQSLMGIGRILKKLERWLDSGKIYERIFREYPDNPYNKKIYLSLSDIYYLEGRLKEAAATAEKAMKYAPENEKADILLFIAEIYESIDYKHALQLYSIISKDIRNTQAQKSAALFKYGALALRMGNRESAILAFETLISNGADSTMVNKAREKLNSLIQQ
jgi:tetratricopeptide (TPR) repeat protein